MKTTLKDIAREAGLDVSTVSRSLSGSYGVRKETRQHVLEVARKLNYRPNRLARGLVTGQSHTLGLLISDIRNPYFTELARGAEDAAYAAGYDVVLCNSDLDPGKQMRYVHSLLEKRVAGLLMNSVSALSAEDQEELMNSGVPVVLLNQPPEGYNFSTVLANNFEGGFLAGSYLIKLGHRMIAHLTGPRQHGNLTEREKGFLKAVNSSDCEVAPIIIHGQQNFQGGCEMTEKILAKHPNITAIFAANDIIAFGVIRTVFDKGLQVPEDISVIGFDNVELSSIIRPPLTTIHQSKYEMGQAAVEILLRQGNGNPSSMPEHRVLGVKLIERQSCCALK
jgi:LacI family transcriptional regulator